MDKSGPESRVCWALHPGHLGPAFATLEMAGEGEKGKEKRVRPHSVRGCAQGAGKAELCSGSQLGCIRERVRLVGVAGTNSL